MVEFTHPEGDGVPELVPVYGSDAEIEEDASGDEYSSAEDDDTIRAGSEPKDAGESDEDDRQADLRRAILAIQLDAQLSPAEKGRKIQALMTGHWHESRGATQRRPSTARCTPSEDAKRPTYNAPHILGCEHYQRGAKLKAACCGRWYTCRVCHDETNNHTLVRRDTKEMMCMNCATVQPAAQDCSNCNERLARYYCDICKFWDDDARKSIYHCSGCGICRVGKEDDFFHCETCNACMSVDRKENHKCIERNLESDCPICGDFMFTSTATVIFMPCGHCIHYSCHSEYIQRSSTCPTCCKSLGNMKAFNERIDAMLAEQKMPAEYEDFVSHVLCNDCERRSSAKYHFLYHKCGECGSYNTRVLQTVHVDPEGGSSSPAAVVGAAAEMARELEREELAAHAAGGAPGEGPGGEPASPGSPFIFSDAARFSRERERGAEHAGGATANDAGTAISNSLRSGSGSVTSVGRRASTASAADGQAAAPNGGLD